MMWGFRCARGGGGGRRAPGRRHLQYLPGRTVFPSDHPLYQGILVRSQPAVRAILEQADLMFALGAEVFPSRSPPEVEPVPAQLTIVHMHSDPWEVGKTYPAKVGIIGDLKASLLSWRRSSAQQTAAQRQEARERAENAAQAKQTAYENLKALAAEVSNRLPIPAAVLMQTIADAVRPRPLSSMNRSPPARLCEIFWCVRPLIASMACVAAGLVGDFPPRLG